MSKKSFSLPKENRVLKSREFKRLFHKGFQKVGKHMLVNYLLEKKSTTKLGLTVSRRYGKAHERNRFKRMAREAFRLSRDFLPQGLVVNLRPLARSKTAKMQDLQTDLMKIFSKKAN